MISAKVLLLESVAAQAAAARNALVGAGYRLVISRLEADGFPKIKDWKPDIVILSDAYAQQSLTDLCRRILSDGGEACRIVVASSLPLERLLAAEPELRSLAAGFVLRPYNPVKLRETIDGLLPSRAEGGASRPEEGRGLEGKKVFLAESDGAAAAAVRKHLVPLGVTVESFSRKGPGRYGATGTPDAVIAGWPPPQGFTLEVLRGLGVADDGSAPPVIVLSSESQETVKAKAPALYNRTKMVFTKPVPWSHFVRFLVRLLAASPAPPAPAALPGAAAEQMKAHFQGQLEARSVEIAELQKRLQESEGRDRGRDLDRRELESLKEENGTLRSRAEELKKQLEIDKAKHQFRETELEVRLSALLRKRSESEKRAQDLIDASSERAEEMQRSLAEAHGEVHIRNEEAAALRKDLEEAIIAKEHVEEDLQALRHGLEKERRELAGEKSRIGKEEGELRKELDEAREALGTYKEWEAALRRELKGHEETIAARDEEIERLGLEQKTFFEEKEGLVARAGQTQEELAAEASSSRKLEEALAEKEKTIAGLRGSLEESERAVAGLDEELGSWRGKSAESEAAVADLAIREAELAERLDEKEKERQELDGRVAELRARCEALENEGEKFRAETERLGEEARAADEDEVSRLKGAVEQKESAIEGFRSALEDAESSENILKGRIAELEKEVEGRDQGLEELGRALLAERTKREQVERDLAFVQSSGVGAELSSERESRESLEKDLAEAQRRIEEESARATRFEEESRRLQEDLEGRPDRESLTGLETALAEVQAEKEDLETRLESELAEGPEREKGLAGRLRSAEEERDALRERVESLTGQSAAHAAELQSAAANLAAKAAEADEVGSRLEGLAKLLEEEREAAERERQEGGRFRRKTEEQSEERQKMLDELAGAQDRNRGLEGELEGLRGQLRELGEEQDRKAGLEEEIGRLQEQQLEFEAAKARSADLEGEVEDLRRLLKVEKDKTEEAEREGRDAGRIQKMLEEVTARAQSEIIERSRKEVELQERLRTSLEEKKFLLARMEKELAGATERERRLSDLLEKSLKGSAQLAVSLGRTGEPDNLPVALAETKVRPSKVLPALVAGIVALVIAGLVWLAVYGIRQAGGPAATAPAAPSLGAPSGEAGKLSAQKEVWEEWSRSDVSGGVLFQATLRSPEEITAAVEAEKKVKGWSDERAAAERTAQLEPYRFEENFYFYVYLKNLEPGYPSYVDNLFANLYLRDNRGREARAFLPADLEKNRRVYSFSSSELSKGNRELIYEVSVPVAFSRGDLSPAPSYLELLVYNVGASSRRVLTWELQ